MSAASIRRLAVSGSCQNVPQTLTWAMVSPLLARGEGLLHAVDAEVPDAPGQVAPPVHVPATLGAEHGVGVDAPGGDLVARSRVVGDLQTLAFIDGAAHHIEQYGRIYEELYSKAENGQACPLHVHREWNTRDSRPCAGILK